MERLESVLLEVIKLGILQSPRFVDGIHSRDKVAIEGELDIEGRVVTIQIVLDMAFPLRLPQIFLKPWDALGFIPHVDQKGLICFADHEGLIWDRRQPLRVIEDSFRRAVSVLCEGVTGTNEIDFVEEFESYWSQIPRGMRAISLLNPSEIVRRITIAINQEASFYYIAEGQKDLSAFHNGANLGGAFTIENGLFVPLNKGTRIIPPRPDGPFWTEDELRHVIVPNMSSSNQAVFKKLTKRNKRIGKNIIVALPRRSGGSALFGVHYERIQDKHPLLEGGTAEKMIPIVLDRWDRNYLIRRGGGEEKLASKRILIIGCGAIGGYLAFELARTGILNLTLVDPDNLNAENTFRHVLGRRYWGQAKTQALKTEIEYQLPYVSVKSVTDRIEAAVSSSIVDFTQYDLVILTTGNPTVELDINERLHSLKDRPLAIFTWLEPLGIGGHALLTGNNLNRGCFECLYTSTISGQSRLDNRAAFAAPGQHFGRSLSGCANFHTPYGSLDAIRTANFAARLAVDAITGREQGNPILSWKGNPSAFIEEGFSLSNRFNYSEAELYQHRYLYISSQCQICGIAE